ncbi:MULTISPECIES: tRNA (adenosine(37)-N6)-dimethylallyltransferase MiaA [Halocynthiibacter]|uniref:tRNA dimethylallyltransferase n=1 Tax=Halocynthiibacter halioticoli TaxID=2986804 RepID=A0AAE3LQC0_9RHOB|nr:MULTISPECIES: tRNA (adenosine(37)-N6)-dimethylallyltransferase MiaA [Halocynthiibacter]MCV6824307.1 tRNA (adenosine(37)-N6)-dimethylallyltransferase MiaA [Halocynthiibacter halioticoli]MCW4057308.1 tRNA (adenosine(37)-N6)-dimethylallyltransferase MiaA [Halocynthiibacter sp. SDUM655004]
MQALPEIPADKPVLIAGPTASGKSALALEIAERHGGVIVNADALQVFDGWNILTARPPAEDLAKAQHYLYGHVPFDANYSVGHWLRDVTPFLQGTGNDRPIIVGGTGLYFQALTQGLVEIPETPAEVRQLADTRKNAEGFEALLAEIDAETASRIDTLNPMRVQRAWEVLTATGRGLAAWQDDTPPPLLPLEAAAPIVMQAEKDWLNDRIERRFHLMIEQGALDEARAMEPTFDPNYLSSKAIGAPELIGYLRGEHTLDEAIEAAIIASRQYAKRQRTWFRSKMKHWHPYVPV